jgi:hypothetical protein
MEESTEEKRVEEEASARKGITPTTSGEGATGGKNVVDGGKEGDGKRAATHPPDPRGCTLANLVSIGVLFPLDLCRTMVVGNCYRCRKVGRVGRDCVRCECPVVPYTTAARPHSARHIYNPFVVARVFGEGLDRAEDPSAFTPTRVPSRAVVAQRHRVLGVDDISLYGIVSRSGRRKSPYRFTLVSLNEEEYGQLADEGGERVVELLERILSPNERVPEQWEAMLEAFERETRNQQE